MSEETTNWLMFAGFVITLLVGSMFFSSQNNNARDYEYRMQCAKFGGNMELPQGEPYNLTCTFK